MTAENSPIIDDFFEFAPDAILVVDAKRRIVRANGRAEALFGYSREELIGKNADILLPRLQQQARDKADGDAPLAKAFAADPEAFARRRDGVEFPVDIMLSPITVDEHSIVTVRDITERKRAEMALSQAYRQLELGVEQHARKLAEVTAALRAEIAERRHTEEQLLRHAEMLDLTHEPIFAWELGKGIVYWNEGAARLYGYSKDEAMGRVSHELLSTFHPRGMAQVEATLNRERGWSGELVHTTRDQRKITVESRMVLVHSSEGKELVIESNRDITERLQSEMALRQAQKMEAVGQLMGGLAHDFNNLLTVMSGNLQMLRERGGLHAGLLKLVDAAGKAAERGAELIQKLLAFSRRQPLRPREIDLNQLVAAMTGMLGRTLGEDIQIETRLAPALPSAVVDPGQVENALLNLALNSRDAMPGGGTLTLETAYLEVNESNVAATGELAPGCYLRLTVSDTGHGMSAEVAERAFEPFFTTKPLGKGSGLGLAMVYGFVKQSGGYARIESKLGQGTTVKLYLPAAMASSALESVQLEGDSEAVIGHEMVLVVEDEQAVRELACAFLSDSGYSVLEAENGPAALSCLKQNTAIDVLFADVVMPGGLSGPELAREALRLRPDLAVLFTSGYAEHALTHDEGRERTVELISKPYTKEALARKVRHVLDQIKRRSERP